MKYPLRRLIRVLLVVIPIISLTGCDEDERLAEQARAAAEQQARQNEEIAQTARDAAENQRRAMEVAEKSRQDTLALQADLQTQRQQLEDERRSLANERYRESLLAPVLSNLGGLLLGLLPILLCILLVKALRDDTACGEEVMEMLAHDLTSNAPVLLPVTLPAAATAIEHQQPQSPTPSPEKLPF